MYIFSSFLGYQVPGSSYPIRNFHYLYIGIYYPPHVPKKKNQENTPKRVFLRDLSEQT